MQMVTEGNFQDSGVVLTPPLCLEGGLAAECRTPNMLQRILSLFKNVRPGSDLTRFELPPLFNVPKSQLQCYGESVYCIGEDILSKCSNAESSLERFANVVAWSISTNRPLIFGVAPFNPVLGETHHASCRTLNVLLEQVSHHPPVSALHATNQKENLELVWCQSANAKFHGASVEVVIHGKRQLNLLNFGEHYEMNAPSLLIRFFPVPGVDWVGNVRIKCKDTGLEANLCYKGNSFLGLGGGSRFVEGKIFDSLSMETIYDIEGHWDRVVTMTDAQSGEKKVLFNAKEAISKLKTPILQHPKVRETDGGVSLTKEGHEEVAEVAQQLTKFCVDEPVKNPLIFGEWDVIYCSRPTSPGGGYRSTIGRFVFKTKEMVQVVEAPDTVKNMVSFSVFGFLDGEVSLKGKLKVLDDKWIQVIFEAPKLKVGALDFQYGGESEVKLEITYIDEKIRLGKGSRGSLFVFQRRR